MKSQQAPADANWYALALLFLGFLCNYIDRTVLSILQVPIQKELGLSDGQLGLLSGIAFTLFYATAALPIARMADRLPRLYILAICLGVWCVMTAACGLATGFWSLLLLRVGVATGEGGGAPCSVSLISDYFSPEKRATALGVFLVAPPIGGMIGFAAGGWLNSAFGWREAFLWVGLSGLVLVPLLLLTLREPVRGRDRYALEEARPPEFWRSIRILWAMKTYRYSALGSAATLFLQFSFVHWGPPFYSRTFGIPVSDVAGPLALTVGLGGSIGVLGAGYLADRLGKTNPQNYMLVPAIGLILVVPIAVAQLYVASFWLSIVLAAFTVMMLHTYVAPHVAMSQRIVPPVMRSFAQAVQTLVVIVLGGGLGPWLVGMASDQFLRAGAEDSLRYALLLALVAAPIGCLCFVRAAAAVATDVAAARAGVWPTNFQMTIKEELQPHH